jgi:hypothetical protein
MVRYHPLSTLWTWKINLKLERQLKNFLVRMETSKLRGNFTADRYVSTENECLIFEMQTTFRLVNIVKNVSTDRETGRNSFVRKSTKTHSN